MPWPGPAQTCNWINCGGTWVISPLRAWTHEADGSRLISCATKALSTTWCNLNPHSGRARTSRCRSRLHCVSARALRVRLCLNGDAGRSGTGQPVREIFSCSSASSNYPVPQPTFLKTERIPVYWRSTLYGMTNKGPRNTMHKKSGEQGRRNWSVNADVQKASDRCTAHLSGRRPPIRQPS